jgi:ATP-dependent DNA helicase RecG
MNLTDSVSTLPTIGNTYTKRLKKLNINTIKDLLFHIPSRYIDLRETSTIKNLKVGKEVTFTATVTSIQNVFTKGGKKIQVAQVSDSESNINLIWFNQPFLVKNLPTGTVLSISGKLSFWNKKRAIFAPHYEKVSDDFENLHTGRLVPIYPETSGISSKRIRQIIKNLLKNISPNDLPESLPEEDIKELGLLNLYESLRLIHFPETKEDAVNAKKRLAFDELLMLHLESENKKLILKQTKISNPLKVKNEHIENFIKNLPFELTKSQKRAIDEIISDFKKSTPMNRLLEGDVGSGKTVVAAAASFIAFMNGFQSVIMAPTQILAQQHYLTLSEIFKKHKIKISLVTSETSKARGKTPKADIYIGTHALIHNKVNFDGVALVVIDEQHRFGVEQRTHLTKKSEKGRVAPHVLTMTATPIPRTVALTLYGDLDLSTLDELPLGRQKIATWVVPPQKREAGFRWIGEQIKRDKIQAFVVCPLIEESEIDTMKEVKAATKEYENLKRFYKGFRLALLHGRLTAKEKNEIIENFRNRKSDILVTTPVVEVGIDIPNATIMVIEGGERFGLSQLHQLRGRVGRGSKKSYCLLMTDSKSPKVKARLNALTKEYSGRVLAELDLEMRGPGEIFGLKQSGFRELKIASWSDINLIKQSKEYAKKIIQDPKKYSKFLSRLSYNT